MYKYIDVFFCGAGMIGGSLGRLTLQYLYRYVKTFLGIFKIHKVECFFFMYLLQMLLCEKQSGSMGKFFFQEV